MLRRTRHTNTDPAGTAEVERPAPPSPIVTTTGLTHLYDGRRGLRDFTLEVEPGECVALLGHNGSGKTTALLCLAGLLSPTAGSVRVAGVDPFVDPEAIRARQALAFVSDAPVFYRDLTVAEHLELVGAAHGVAEELGNDGWEERKRALITKFGLDAHHDGLPHQLSAGLRQRTQLACAFARPFEILVLDEPILRLDLQGQAMLARTIEAVAAEGRSVLFTAHARGFARQLARRVLILENGVMQAEGTWGEAADSPSGRRLGLSE